MDGPGGQFDPARNLSSVVLDHLSSIALDTAGNAYIPIFWGDKGLLIEQVGSDGALTVTAGGGTTTAGGVAATDFQVLDALCLAVDPLTNDVLLCSPDSRVYRISVPPVAGP
jgi:hypothetical protein